MNRQLEELSAFVHGVLFTLHGLGVLYNLRKRNWLDVSIHSGAAIYDLRALQKHMKRI